MRIIIIGGGASGVLLAHYLVRMAGAGTRITLVEKTLPLGRGVAYGTDNPSHLLNVRASNMSAYPDDPDHFWRWLRTHEPTVAASGEMVFAPRRVYARYLESLAADTAAHAGDRFRVVAGECTGGTVSPDGVEIALRDAASLSADVAVLATGNERPRIGSDGLRYSAWDPLATADLARDSRVLIRGTGLTMVDYVQSLLQTGHRGPLIAMSRRGRISQVHRHVPAMSLAESDIPFGRDISAIARWFRITVRRAEREGHDWRSVADGIRPFSQKLWQSLPLDARRRLLRHAQAWWDIHRHRMPPHFAHTIAGAVADGRLQIVAGKISTIEPASAGASVTFRRRGHAAAETIEVTRIVECTGLSNDPRASANPVLRSFLDQGLIRADPLGLGVETTSECAVIGADGNAARRLFAVGPITRPAFGEIIAIPDIRVQCVQLAARLAEMKN